MKADHTFRVSIAQIRASQDFSGTAIPLSRYIEVPAAWPLTWLLLRAGCSANAVTAMRLAVGVLALPLIAQPQLHVHWLGLLVFALSLILDQVDGQICRVKNQASYFGKFFDGVADAFTEIPLPIMLGLHVWLRDGAVGSLIAGFVASAALALIYITLLRFGLLANWVQATVANASASHHPRLRRFLDAQPMASVGEFVNVRMPLILSDLRYGGLIVAVVFGQLGLYLVLFCILHIAALAALAPLRLLDAYDRFDIHRLSRTAANRSSSSS
jgi:phosphatidylglycerophosphate synthase